MKNRPQSNDRTSGLTPLAGIAPEPLSGDFTADERHLDERLTALANRVTPPEGMTDRIFAATVRDLPLTMPTGTGGVLRVVGVGTAREKYNRRRLTPLRTLAMVASVAIVAVVGYWQFGGTGSLDGPPAPVGLPGMSVHADGTTGPVANSDRVVTAPAATDAWALHTDAERELFVGNDDDSSLDLLLATRDATFDDLSGELAMALVEMDWNGFEAPVAGGRGR